MMNSIGRNGLVLCAFALVTTALIALTFSGTKDEIERQELKKRLAILTAIVPADLYDNDIEHDCTLVTNYELLGSADPQRIFRARLNGQASAAAIEVTAPNGYSGKIKLIVGVNEQSTVTGVRTLKHKETPGLGDKIDLRVSDWILSFTDTSLTDENASKWKVKKDGGQFDQFTGATITPRAVVGAVKNAIIYYQQNQDSIFAAVGNCESGDTEKTE